MRGIERADKLITRFFDVYSGISVVAVLIVILICVVDVVGSKLFTLPFAPAYEMTQLLSIPLVFCTVGTVQMGRGMMRIDLLFNKFHKTIQRILNIISSTLGVALCIFLTVRSFVYTNNTLLANHMKTTGNVHLIMWPFGIILVVGLAMLSIAYVFTLIRNIISYEVLPDLSPDQVLEVEVTEKDGILVNVERKNTDD